MKRYRNENGQLTMTLDQIKKETAAEAARYYRPGNIYQNIEDGREYVYLVPTPEGGELAHFQSFDGYNLFIPVDSLGTFLPDVASKGTDFCRIDEARKKGFPGGSVPSLAFI